MQRYLRVDPIYKDLFTEVWLWKEWTALRTDFDGVDIGIDLVARDRDGGYCAIQCKCYGENTRITKPQIDSFFSASASDVFTKRMLIHTSGGLNANVKRTIDPLGDKFHVIGYGHLASRPIDWPDLRYEVPEQLDYRQVRFSLQPHQQEAFDDVIKGFKESDRGKLIMACGTGKTFTALRIAEEIAGINGRVLYLVPSIGLFSQAMREWAEQQEVQHRYIGICSDTSAGKKTEDVPIQELEILHEARSISGFSDWQKITPDKHHDWIGQRSPAFARLYPLGSDDAKAGRADDAIFGLYSPGVNTARDAYIYNFSRNTCAENARRMTQDYRAALSAIEENPELTPDEASRQYAKNVKWNRELKNQLKRKNKTKFAEDYLRKAAYRPFVATNCYANYTFITMKGQTDRIFPDSLSENRVICVPGIGSTKQFSVLMTDTMTDLNINEAGTQCFPRYRYPKPTEDSDTTDVLQGIGEPLERIDNISDTALYAFREHYQDNTITKDAIFDYVYGILHASSYREDFANDLSKELPRIPFAPDFHAFAEAGKELAALHLGYETCEQYPLSLMFAHDGEPQPHHFRLTERAMRLLATPAKTTLTINEHVRLTGIPEDGASVYGQRQNAAGVVH